MARVFNEHNIPAISLTSDSSSEERKNAKDNLVKGVYKFIFCVDIYNEGDVFPTFEVFCLFAETQPVTDNAATIMIITVVNALFIICPP